MNGDPNTPVNTPAPNTQAAGLPQMSQAPVSDQDIDFGQNPEISANQAANQGESLGQTNPMLAQAMAQDQKKQNEQSVDPSSDPAQNIPQPPATPPNQKQIFGKSELLDSHQILAEMLGITMGNRVADLGTGGGLFALQAARLVGEQGEIYAVDIIKPSLSDVESKARMAGLYNIKTVWSNIEILGATKIPEGTLDFVMLVNVLFQSDKHDAMMAEANRLLKSGGKLLIIDWSTTTPNFTPQKERQVDPEELKQHAAKLNLIIEQEFKAGQYHFGLIFIKP